MLQIAFESAFGGALIGVAAGAFAWAVIPWAMRVLSQYWLNPSNTPEVENDPYFNREYARPQERKPRAA